MPSTRPSTLALPTTLLLTLGTGVAAAQPDFAPAYPIEDRFIVFLVSLLVGGFAIYIGARLTLSSGTYAEAVLTALIGAIAWAILEPIPLLGTVLALIAWVAVLKWRYPVGWLRAIILGVLAWLVAVVVLSILAILGIGSLGALGVPGA